VTRESAAVFMASWSLPANSAVSDLNPGSAEKFLVGASSMIPPCGNTNVPTKGFNAEVVSQVVVRQVNEICTIDVNKKLESFELRLFRRSGI